MAEPISDDELQRLRKALGSFDPALSDWRHNCGKEHLTPTPLSQSEWHLLHEAKKCDGLPGLLARLDAAESRAAELQREVDRLNGFLEMRQIIC